MTRPTVCFIAALALLGATGIALWWPRHVREVPLVAPLERVPITLQGWQGSNHVPNDVLPVDARAPVQLLRTYRNGANVIWLAVGYYRGQADGRRPPTRDLLFPGQGWSELSERGVRVPVGGPRGNGIPATLVIRRSQERQVAVLYWYELPGRAVGSDHWYRMLLLFNRVVHGRSDGALVRVAAPVPRGVTPDAVVVRQAEFLRAFYPELLRTLPR